MLQNLSPDSINNILSFLETYQKSYTELALVSSSVNEVISRIDNYNEFLVYNIPTKLITKHKNISFSKLKYLPDLNFKYLSNLNILDMIYCEKYINMLPNQKSHCLY